ncbi:MAG: dephospho-CoA kinase [Clostridiales bacterium]|nr:dephospho-CoA kinase [Clostridiales bacterium]
MTIIIGLTGGIASGKTTVSNILRELGAIIIDADEISRKIVEKGKPALDEIREYFGEKVLLENGELNRKKLGDIVFDNAEELRKLSEITLPYIVEEITDEINLCKETYNDCVIVLDAALLIEQNLMYLVEEIWLVVAPRETQFERLVEREDISRDGAEKRIDAQMSPEHKKKYAHKIIDNSKDLDHLRAQIEANWKRVTG